MAWDGIWRLTDPPMSGEQVAQIQSKALRAFASYAVPLGVKVTGLYDGPTSAFIAEYQRRKNASGYRPTLPSNPTAKAGDCDYATKIALGLIPSAIVTPKPPPAVAYSVAGTWAGWNDGPPAWACWRLDHSRFYHQGVSYPAMGFMQPDPNVSYNESRDAGISELIRLALPDPRPKVWIGYSQGADVVTRALYQWPADRRQEIVLVVKYGDPGHLPGVQGSVNGGISRVFTPEWAAGRTLSYQISGDMYGDAPGLLPFLYDILTRLKASGEFLFFMFGLLTGIPVTGGAGGLAGGLGGLGSLVGGLGGLLGGPIGGLIGGLGGGMLGNLGGGLIGGLTPTLDAGSAPAAPPNLLGSQLLGLPGTTGGNLPGFGSLGGILGLITPGPVAQTGGPISLLAMLMNIPAIIQTLMAALQFVFTNAHMHYGGDGSAQIFNGVDAVIDSANAINRLAIP